MTDKTTPERIWAEPYSGGDGTTGRWTSTPRDPTLPTQYVCSKEVEDLEARLLIQTNLAVSQAKTIKIQNRIVDEVSAERLKSGAAAEQALKKIDEISQLDYELAESALVSAEKALMYFGVAVNTDVYVGLQALQNVMDVVTEVKYGSVIRG